MRATFQFSEHCSCSDYSVEESSKGAGGQAEVRTEGQTGNEGTGGECQ